MKKKVPAAIDPAPAPAASAPPEVKAAPGKPGRPRKAEAGHVYARSMEELGRVIAPPRDRKIIQRGMKLAGNPGRSADGRYEIKAWQDFVNHHFAANTVLPDKAKHEIERLELQNERMKLENAIRRGEFMDTEEVCRVLGDAFAAFSAALQHAKNNLAPLVVGVQPGEAAKRIGVEHREALRKLSVPDWAKKKAFWRTVSARLFDLHQRFLPGDGQSSMS